MLSFARGLSPNNEAFAIFVSENYEYKDKGNILSRDINQKINLFLKTLKQKKK